MTILCKSLSCASLPYLARSRLVNMLVSGCRFCHPIRTNAAAIGLFFCLALVSSGSEAQTNSSSDATVGSFASSWSTQAGGSARMRLVSMPLSSRGKPVYDAAVEIKLASSAITYWRQPGEAGVPPQFSFKGSENVARVDFLFPGPHRLDEDGLEAFGYRGGVTFPIRVTPVDASKPARLVLTLDYAVCDRICVPVRGHAELQLPRSGDSPARAVILAGEAAVPETLPSSELAKKVVIRQEAGQAKPQWQFMWRGDQPMTDLFVEGPEGWVFTTHKTGANTYSIAALETPATPAATVFVKLTVTGPKPYEFTVPLGIASGRH